MSKSQLYNSNQGGLFITSSPDFVEVPKTRVKYIANDSGDINISISFSHISGSIIVFAHTLFIGDSSGSAIPYQYGGGVAGSSNNPGHSTFNYKISTSAGQSIEVALAVKVFQGALFISVNDPPQITIITEL